MMNVATPPVQIKSSTAKKTITGNGDVSHCRTLLQKMANNWHERSQVAQAKQKAKENGKLELVFDETKDDFRIDLLPFKNHPDFLAAPIEMQKKILSCGWIAYNEKTLDIESKIIFPACNHIIYQEVPGVEDGTSQQIASDVLTDEAYHVLLTVTACRMTRERRNLEFLKLPSFCLVRNMIREQEHYSQPWQKMLIQLVTATVSEIFVSDYLELLAHDRTIQPFNRFIVDTHRRDEMNHNSIFRNLARCIYAQLNKQQQEFYMKVLPKPVIWFASSELEIWKVMLEQLDFQQTERMIADCNAAAEVNLMRIDYSGIVELAEELGIFNSSCGVDSFGQAGLLN
jgi:P-aminobenzoate N-oxygenase AurF